MDHKISIEQKTHDLAVAYATYSISISDKENGIEDFYQEYENAYQALLPIVNHYA